MDKILNLLKQGNIIIPTIFFNNYRKLELDEKEFLLLCYLMNNNNLGFNPKQIGLNIGYSFKEVLEIIDSLTNKGFIDIELKKDSNIKEECINLDKLYSKLAFLVMNEEVKEEATDLFSIFEREFGRTLSSIECELINAWKDSNYSEDLIKEALKEAVLNGVSNLRYIDKILYEWNKKGIKKASDISKKREPVKKEKVEVFDYDWLNED